MAMKVVDSSFQSITGKLEKMLAEEAALLAGVEDDVRYIIAELKSITSFLTAMSTGRKLDDQLHNWVREVKEVAYDAEDLIDEFNCRLRSTPYDKCGIKGLFMRFCRRLKSLKARHGIALELKKLKVEVEEIKRRHDRYSLPNGASTSSGTATSLDMDASYSDPRTIGHFVEEVQLVGINESRDKLIGWVMDNNCLELTAISLLGFGGLGKTTLAKTVYDAPAIVGGHFQCRAWIAVSQRYNIRELLKKIIRQISVEQQQIRDVVGCQDAKLNTEQLLNMMDEPQLVQTVKGHLHGKSYLVVFDDVWKTQAWESLSIALPPGKEGSRVIVTTRIEEVANTCCSRNHQFIFKISPLSAELSWELFCRKVFDESNYSCPPELENVGREILQKCNGLPLAILTIGGLLASKPDKKLEDWKDLRDHLRLEIQTNDMLSKINQILTLSYNDLPYYLKPCFLFLGIFPEDYEIRLKNLMRLWIAEGIVSGVGGFPAEKAAERCFNQLVSRSLVQPSEFDEFGKVKSCRIHDVMLELIVSISKEENFVVLLNEQSAILSQHHKIRRLSWHGGRSGRVPETDLCHLRSFTAFCKDVPPKAYTVQRLLRTVHLNGCRRLHSVGLKTFPKLFLLKYLSVRDTEISELPKSIGDLQNLEFLDIRGTFIRTLPHAIVKLENLVHLLAGDYELSSHVALLTGDLKVPKGIRKLKELRTFGMVSAGNVQLLQEIGELVKLEKLGIDFGFDRAHRMVEEISALLSKLNGSLQSLKINATESNMTNALNEVALPPLRLHKFQIVAELGRLPAWFASLTQVVKITLSDTQLQLQDVQVLRNLNTLVKLVLGFNSFVDKDKDLVFDQGGFAHLKSLVISTHNVSFEEGAIQSLEIFKLFSLRYISVNGVEHLHGLKEVHIHTADEGMAEMVKNIAANHSKRPKCFVEISSIMRGR